MSLRPLRVYVAGSSAELERARWAMSALDGYSIEVTHDWVSSVEEVGSANPAEATDDERLAWADDDLSGVYQADVLWLLMPKQGSIGAYVELGLAIALGMPIVISGDHERSIFTVFGERFEQDADALDWITDLIALPVETVRYCDRHETFIVAIGDDEPSCGDCAGGLS